MDETTGISKAARIEVSGWGPDDSFFVEKTELLRNESGDERICLRQALADGSLVFVRLAVTGSAVSSTPSPYRIENTGTTNDAGWREVRLQKLERPSTTYGTKTTTRVHVRFS